MRILCNILVVLFVTATAVGQQINPVPDYIFRNSMSVGRNAPTDTSAYFSIGPRFGATRGFMPPMVVDTASVTGTKRNGLLIYSIQRNSFLYWDSTGMRWSRIAANLDTLLLSTRAWRQKGIDSLASVRVGGSGTTNYVPKFTASSTLGDSKLFDNGTQLFYNQTTQVYRRVTALEFDQGQLWVKSNGTAGLIGLMGLRDSTAADVGGLVQFHAVINNTNGDQTEIARIRGGRENATEFNTAAYISFSTKTAANPANATEAFRITSTQESLFGTTTDAGDFRVQINGNQYVNGNVGIGTTSPASTLHINATATPYITLSETSTTERMSLQMIQGSVQFTANAFFSSSWQRNNTALPSWNLFMTPDNTDRFIIRRAMKGTGSVNWVNFVMVDSSGNMGIGTTSPSEKLHVVGNIKTTASIDIGGDNVISSSGRTFVNMGTSGTTRWYSSGAGTGIQFYPNNVLGMFIDDDNELMIAPPSGTVDSGDYKIQVFGNTFTNGSITTSSPSSGSKKPWKLGEAATVSPTSPNRTIRVEIDGVVYYIHAKTTND